MADGNSIAMREALMFIKQYFDAISPYKPESYTFSDIEVEHINDAIRAALAAPPEPEPPSDAFEMREGLRHIRRMAQEAKCTTDSFVRQQLVDNICSAAAAFLALPPRNCDRCEYWEELWQEFSTRHCPVDVTDDCQRAWLFIRWLFDKKEGGGHVAD